MKMKQIGLCLLVLCVGLFTACNDDDYDKNQDFTNYAEQVEGNYSGDLDSQISGTEKDKQNKVVKLTMDGHNYVRVALKELQVTLPTGEKISLEDVIIQSIPIAKSGDKITFDDSKEIRLMETASHSAQLHIYGSVSSDKKLDLTIDFLKTSIEEIPSMKLSIIADKIDAEAQILKMTFDNKSVEKNAFVDDDGNFSLGYVQDAALEDLTEVTVNLEISDFATVEPASGSKVDFSKGPVQFTVTAQDKGTKVVYAVTPFKMNKGAQILKMTFDNKFVKEDAFVDNDGNFSLGHTLDITLEDLTEVIVNLEISDLATVEPASGSKVDFSKGPVQFTVTAQDKVTQAIYTVTPFATEKSFAFDMEEWYVENPKSKEIRQFMSLVGGWTSSNHGVDYMKMFGSTYVPLDAKCVTKTADANTGSSAARIETLDSKGGKFGAIAIPKVTSGSLYLGTFKTVPSNTLKSTKFGILFANKPIRFSGYYKYAPGSATIVVQVSLMKRILQYSNPALSTNALLEQYCTRLQMIVMNI